MAVGIGFNVNFRNRPAIRAVPIGEFSANEVKRILEDRRCSHPECNTKLSGYNRSKDSRCYAHAGYYFPRLRGKTT